MSDLLQTAMIGARHLMQAQAVNANNLANASTDGFRAELAHVLDAQSAEGLASTTDLRAGNVRSTGRPLDLSINGAGWIAVIGADGTEGYTRRGDLQVDSLGQVRNGAGQQLLGNNGPVALPPHESVAIAPDGTISIRPLGQPPNTLAVIDRLKLVSPAAGDLRRGEDGLMRLPVGQVAEADAAVSLVSGTLEGSNVNAVEAMVRMIDLARQFEAHIQLMKSSQDNEASLNKLMSMN